MTTSTELVNAALRRVGGQRITDITDPVGSAGIAADILANERDSLLRAGTWNFATTRAQLAALTDTPVFGFDHAFALPTGCLRLISVHNDTQSTTETRYKLESIRQSDDTYIGAILADDDVLYVRYVRQVTDPNLMTTSFQGVLILALALVFAISVAKSNELHSAIGQEYDAAMRQARSIDGIEDQIDQLQEGSWARSRRGRWASNWPSPDWPT